MLNFLQSFLSLAAQFTTVYILLLIQRAQILRAGEKGHVIITALFLHVTVTLATSSDPTYRVTGFWQSMCQSILRAVRTLFLLSNACQSPVRAKKAAKLSSVATESSLKSWQGGAGGNDSQNNERLHRFSLSFPQNKV